MDTPMDANGHYEELMRQIKIVKDRVRGLVYGETNGLYLYGRPGTSKTFTVCSTLDTLGVVFPLAKGHLTPIGLFDLIEDNHNRVSVLDDVLETFHQPIALQILLAALGNPHDGSRVRPIHHTTAKSSRTVMFT